MCHCHLGFVNDLCGMALRSRSYTAPSVGGINDFTQAYYHRAWPRPRGRVRLTSATVVYICCSSLCFFSLALEIASVVRQSFKRFLLIFCLFCIHFWQVLSLWTFSVSGTLPVQTYTLQIEEMLWHSIWRSDCVVTCAISVPMNHVLSAVFCVDATDDLMEDSHTTFKWGLPCLW